MGQLAILAGCGGLPPRLKAAASEAICVSFAGVSHRLGDSAREHQFEKMGALFQMLKSEGVTDVVMAGAMSRPPLDPAQFDAVMTELAPRLMVAMQSGDDGLLRVVIDIFEEQGFTVRGAHEIDPTLTLPIGVLVGSDLDAAQRADAARGKAILNALSPVDVGQGVVVEKGLCLGVETLQGTDALLGFVSDTPAHLRKSGGVFVKAPKLGQDLRVDMPTIGPATVTAVRDAGLSAIVLQAGKVLVLEQDAVVDLARQAGITILAEEF